MFPSAAQHNTAAPPTHKKREGAASQTKQKPKPKSNYLLCRVVLVRCQPMTQPTTVNNPDSLREDREDGEGDGEKETDVGTNEGDATNAT